jgi:hypothetical protein
MAVDVVWHKTIPAFSELGSDRLALLMPLGYVE